MGWFEDIVESVSDFVSDAVDQRNEWVSGAFGDAGPYVTGLLSPVGETFGTMAKAEKDDNWTEFFHAGSTGSPFIDRGLAGAGTAANSATNGQYEKYVQYVKPVVNAINPIAGTITSLAINRSNKPYYMEKYGLTDKEASDMIQRQNLTEQALYWGTYGIGQYAAGLDSFGESMAGASGAETAGYLTRQAAANAAQQAANSGRTAVPYSEWTGQGGESAVNSMGKGLVYDSSDYMQAANNLGMSPNIGLMDYYGALPQGAQDAGSDILKSALKAGAKEGYSALIGSLMGDMLPSPTLQTAINVGNLSGGGVPVTESSQLKDFNPTGMPTSADWNTSAQPLSRVDTNITDSKYPAYTLAETEAIKKEKEKKLKNYLSTNTIKPEDYAYLAA